MNKKQINVDTLNLLALQDSAELINCAEKQYHDQVRQVAETINANKADQKIVLIAGPSASGKTTTSILLQNCLEGMGVNTERISLDNFFKSKEQAPVLSNGQLDFESVQALNIDQIHTCFIELLKNKHTDIPLFDFKLGRPNGTLPLTITNDVVIIEGIHALNPVLIPQQAAGKFHKVYISVRTEFENQGNVLLNPTDLRLMRRLLRDLDHRNSSISYTLDMWNNVLFGERNYIQPFMNQADDVIDSIHLYEPLIYHKRLLPLLVENRSDAHREQINELQYALEQFGELDESQVPENSLINEFI